VNKVFTNPPPLVQKVETKNLFHLSQMIDLQVVLLI